MIFYNIFTCNSDFLTYAKFNEMYLYVNAKKNRMFSYNLLHFPSFHYYYYYYSIIFDRYEISINRNYNYLCGYRVFSLLNPILIILILNAFVNKPVNNL